MKHFQVDTMAGIVLPARFYFATDRVDHFLKTQLKLLTTQLKFYYVTL